METRILNPLVEKCRCVNLTNEELGHFTLVGDKRLQEILDDLEFCTTRGWLGVPDPH